MLYLSIKKRTDDQMNLEAKYAPYWVVHTLKSA